MSNGAIFERAAAVPTPFDYESAESLPYWRDGFVWPVAHRESFEKSYAALRALLAVVRECDDIELRDIALLSLGMVYASALPSAEAALAVAQENAQGLEMTTSAPEVAFLRGDTDTVPPARNIGVFRNIEKPSMALARRFARLYIWTPLSRLPATLFSPDAVAVSHNGLLRDAVGDTRVGFHHADSLFLKIRNGYGGRAVNSAWREVADLFADAFVSAYPLCPGLQGRLRLVVAAPIAGIVEVAAQDIGALRAARRLPEALWAGTGGAWASRALAIEVLRRGGTVRRFDHGGGLGLNSLALLWATTELCVSSEFTSPTPALAARVAATEAQSCLPREQSLTLSGGMGDPLYRKAARIARSAHTGPRRITYTPISLIGYRQMMPPRLPDLVNLDWQMRFAELLRGMLIELTCRPHPEGLFSNRPNPLGDVVPLSPRVFEDLIADTDVFVFDYIQSTTFYEALCTDRPIVLIDFGLPIYTGDARALLEARCRIVPARFDERNRPHVDTKELTEAVCGGDRLADPIAFRELLAGRER